MILRHHSTAACCGHCLAAAMSCGGAVVRWPQQWPPESAPPSGALQGPSGKARTPMLGRGSGAVAAAPPQPRPASCSPGARTRACHRAVPRCQADDGLCVNKPAILSESPHTLATPGTLSCSPDTRQATPQGWAGASSRSEHNKSERQQRPGQRSAGLGCTRSQASAVCTYDKGLRRTFG